MGTCCVIFVCFQFFINTVKTFYESPTLKLVEAKKEIFCFCDKSVVGICSSLNATVRLHTPPQVPQDIFSLMNPS